MAIAVVLQSKLAASCKQLVFAHNSCNCRSALCIAARIVCTHALHNKPTHNGVCPDVLDQRLQPWLAHAVGDGHCEGPHVRQHNSPPQAQEAANPGGCPQATSHLCVHVCGDVWRMQGVITCKRKLTGLY